MEADEKFTNGDMPGQENYFQYSYSAPQHDEVRKIREKYLPRAETPMEQLRRLDKRVTQKGAALSLAVGVIGMLILGIGMCSCMVWGGALYGPGIVIGLVGLTGIGLANPMYVSITRKERERVAPEILRIADELLK